MRGAGTGAGRGVGVRSGRGGSCLAAATGAEAGDGSGCPSAATRVGAGREQLPCGGHERGNGWTGVGQSRSDGAGGKATGRKTKSDDGGDPVSEEPAAPNGESASEEPTDDSDPVADRCEARSAARRALRAACDGGRLRWRAARAACERV